MGLRGHKRKADTWTKQQRWMKPPFSVPVGVGPRWTETVIIQNAAAFADRVTEDQTKGILFLGYLVRVTHDY